MAAKGQLKTVILFEDEVRLAAKACAGVRDLAKDVTDEEWLAASSALLQACMTALDGAEDDAACVLLGRKPNSFAV